MNPLIGAALIGTGGNLLSAALGTSEKNKLRQQANVNFDLMKRKQDLMRSRVMEDLKPKNERYMSSQHMSRLDSILKKVLMGRMGSEFGKSMGDWGVNMNDIFDYLNPGGGYANNTAAATTPSEGGGFRGPIANGAMADKILNKYGMGGGRGIA